MAEEGDSGGEKKERKKKDFAGSGAWADMKQTLSIFLVAVLSKKYTNPSSDIIEVLSGLDHIDTAFTEFVGALDAIIRNGRSCEWLCFPALYFGTRETNGGREKLTSRVTVELREKAVEVALAVASGAYQTSLLTYFIQRDLFQAIMKVRDMVIGARR